MESSANIESILRDPSSHFASPADVLADLALGADQKLAILRQWEQDALELQQADNEGMGGGEQDMLRLVYEAIRELTGED